MADDDGGQRGSGVRFDWGVTGALRVTEPDGVLVVVDVLSFTTAVCVAVERGTAVVPAPWRDERAAGLAVREGASLAVGRHEVDDDHPWSLSPAALAVAPAAARLVLPSPNGSALVDRVARERPGVTVVAACLRNAEAVGRWLRGAVADGQAVAVVAAGERWPDGSLRPALEDLLGAGAVVASLATRHRDGALSPEAEAARACFVGTGSVPDAVRGSASGQELLRAGFAPDVEVAVQADTSSTVPVLRGSAFTAARDPGGR